MKRIRNMIIHGGYKYHELYGEREKLTLGTIVEFRLVFGEDKEKRHGKVMKGEVVEKYKHHFLVKVRNKRGAPWNESFKYIDLLPDEKGNVAVCVIKKGKK